MLHANRKNNVGHVFLNYYQSIVNEHGASKRSCSSYVPRPLTGFSIHETSNTPVISSSDEEEENIEFHTPYTTPFLIRGEGSNCTYYFQ
jgi:hypothetical protein